jgi:hypothetical protein
MNEKDAFVIRFVMVLVFNICCLLIAAAMFLETRSPWGLTPLLLVLVLPVAQRHYDEREAKK